MYTRDYSLHKIPLHYDCYFYTFFILLEFKLVRFGVLEKMHEQVRHISVQFLSKSNKPPPQTMEMYRDEVNKLSNFFYFCN